MLLTIWSYCLLGGVARLVRVCAQLRRPAGSDYSDYTAQHDVKMTVIR